MELEIERLGHLGDGLANGPIFVARALPGEIVSGDLNGNRLENVRIVKSSDKRIASVCSAFKRCGGCAMHHAHPNFVSSWKQEVTIQALATKGITAKAQAIHTSPENSRRRAKLSGKRTKSGSIVGFFGKASNVIQPIESCKVLAPEILAIIPALELFTARFGSRKGQLGFWVLSSNTGVDISIEGIERFSGLDLEWMAEWAKINNVARLSLDDEIICQHQEPSVVFGKVRIVPPPRGFAQATLHGEQALQNAVSCALKEADLIIDLFSGAGTLSLPIAEFANIHSVESDRVLLDAVEHGVRRTQAIKKVSTEVRDLFRNPIPHLDLAQFKAAIIDPPRAGAEKQVAQLAQSKVQDIAMVSCDPVTFARDASILCAGGYFINWLEVVDQFRWSSHIEIVAHFRKV